MKRINLKNYNNNSLIRLRNSIEKILFYRKISLDLMINHDILIKK